MALLLKEGVSLDGLAEAGARIMSALEEASEMLEKDLTLTCTTGDHPPTDPHSNGNAIDIRTRDLEDAEKAWLREYLRIQLGRQFYVAQEMDDTPGATAEHLHVQLRKGVVYEP